MWTQVGCWLGEMMHIRMNMIAGILVVLSVLRETESMILRMIWFDWIVSKDRFAIRQYTIKQGDKTP